VIYCKLTTVGPRRSALAFLGSLNTLNARTSTLSLSVRHGVALCLPLRKVCARSDNGEVRNQQRPTANIGSVSGDFYGLFLTFVFPPFFFELISRQIQISVKLS